MRQTRRFLLGVAVAGALSCAFSQSHPCPRFPAGNTVRNPPNTYSHDGTPTVDLSYNTFIDADGRSLYCFTAPNGTGSPTLYAHAGDRLIVNVKNNLPKVASTVRCRWAPTRRTCAAQPPGRFVGEHSLPWNERFAAVSSDEAIHTLINSGQAFT
jgi:hypothetical protein